jgi:hypothetical protein
VLSRIDLVRSLPQSDRRHLILKLALNNAVVQDLDLSSDLGFE